MHVASSRVLLYGCTSVHNTVLLVACSISVDF